MNLPVAASPDGEPEKALSESRAKELSKSKLVPEHFADDPASVQYIGEMARYLGVDPVAALANIHVFKDKKTGRLKAVLSANLMVTLAHMAGHRVAVRGNAQMATATLIRTEFRNKEEVQALKDLGVDPKDFLVFEETWTADRARAMGLPDIKDVWKNYMPEMLKARVKSSIVHSACPEVIVGIRGILESKGVALEEDSEEALAVEFASHTAEELDFEVDAEGVPVEKVSTPQQSLDEKVIDFVNSHSDEEVVHLAKEIFSDEKNSVDGKLYRLKKLYDVCVHLNRHRPSGKIPEGGESGNVTHVGKEIKSLGTILESKK